VTGQARPRLRAAAGALAVAATLLLPSTSAASSDAQATAVVDRWIADVEADADRAEAAIAGADIWFLGHACGTEPRCAARAIDAARLGLTLPARTTSVRVIGRDLYRSVLVGPFAHYRREPGHDDLTWVAWEARFERATSGFENAVVVVALAAHPDGSPRIVAAAIGRTPWHASTTRR
jgi:hypothetical protein